MGAANHGGAIHYNLPVAPMASGDLRFVRIGIAGVALDSWGRGVGRTDGSRDSGVGTGRTAQSLSADSGAYGRRPQISGGSYVRRGWMESRVLTRLGIWSRTISGNHRYGAGGIARDSVGGSGAVAGRGPSVSERMPIGGRSELAAARFAGARRTSARLLRTGGCDLPHAE